MFGKLKKAARVTLMTCLEVQPHERLLIVADDDSPEKVVQALYDEARSMGIEVAMLQITPRQFNGEELPDFVARLLKQVDVYLGPTSKSFSHTDARRDASKSGVRGATLPGVNEDIFKRLMAVDYQAIAAKAKVLVERITRAKSVRITSENGTDLVLGLGNTFEPDDGMLSAAGAFGNLPAGEVMGAPSGGKGTLVIDAMGDIITEPTTVVIGKGEIIDIQPNKSGERFKDLLEKAARQDGNRNAFKVAELGIGLNPLAKISGEILEDEKVLGTIHVAFGDNSSYPGGKNTASIHLDGVVLEPKLYFDDQGEEVIGELVGRD